MSEEKDQGKNVIDMQEVKAKKEPRPSKYKVYEAIYKVLDGTSQFTLGAKYRAVRYETGSRVICLENEHQELLIAGGDDAPSRLLKFCDRMAKHEARYFINLKEANAILETWRAKAETIEPPVPVRFKNEYGSCFRRIPFEPAPGPTPTWESLLDRLTNQRAFMSFIGSLFVQGSYLQQYVWLTGGGGDGKGAIGRWLEEIFQQSFFMTAEAKANGFWMHSLLNKRVCVFSDWDNPEFTTKGLFKSMSGGDSMTIEGKYRDPIKARLNCKFVFFSNERPEILMRNSDKRRLIYCELEPIPEEKREHAAFEKKLFDESAAFIFECLKVYREDCPTNGPIPTITDAVDELAGGNESYFQGLFDQYFEMGGRVESAQMSAWLLRKQFKSETDRRRWFKFIRDKGARNKKSCDVRYWDGIKLHINWAAREAYDLTD